ncbi:MAG: right-handed parallel beta-helix repeat-containing protein [Myxococcota bacterium]
MRGGLAVLGLLTSPAYAATIAVPADFATVQGAIDASADGDTIQIGPGTYSGGAIAPHRLILQGAGEDATTLTHATTVITTLGAAVEVYDLAIEADGGRGVRAELASLTLENVRISGGQDLDGGAGIYVFEGTVIARSVTLVDNRTDTGFGAHIYAVDSDVQVEDSRLESGRAERGGALFSDGGTLTVRSSTLNKNSAEAGLNRGIGGAVGTERAKVVLDDVRFENNRVVDGLGGNVSVFLGEAQITGCTFIGAESAPTATEYYGGGLAIYDAPLRVEDSEFRDLSVEHSGEDGTFGYGGAVIIYGPRGADFAFRRTTFTGNQATAFGGAVRIDSGAGLLEDCTFDGNFADYGAGLHIASGSEVTVQTSEFTANDARFSAAIRWRPSSADADTAALNLVGNRFIGNSADRYGGVMYGRGAARLRARNNQMWNNTAELGGALMLWEVADIELVGNHFCGNQVEGGTSPDGGALASFLSGSTAYNVYNNVFQRNSAVGYGGAISLLGDGAATVRNNTFLANTAADGGGLSVRGRGETQGMADVVNNLFAYTVRGDGVSTEIAPDVSLRNNAFFQNSSTDVDEAMDAPDATHVFDEPGLLSFANDDDCANDQPFAYLGSPLIDAGDPTLTDLDGSRSDIGASGGPDADPALWADEDEDGDPFLTDCDDNDPQRGSGAAEVPYDGVDQDCDGQDLVDVDGDGVPGPEEDCDDTQASVFPGAPEVPDDGVDQDCDGQDEVTPTEPAPDPETGCGCTSAPSAPMGWVGMGALLGVVLLRRRRRS